MTTTIYSRLSTSSDDLKETLLPEKTDGQLESPFNPAEKSQYSKTYIILSLFFIISAAINIFQTPYGYAYDRPSEWIKLRQLYPYPGHGKLHRGLSSPDWPMNYTFFPDTVAHIDADGVQRTFENSSHVSIDASVSLILQFRVHGISAETCRLIAWFPTRETAFPKSWFISSETTKMEVWLIDEAPFFMTGIDQRLSETITRRERRRFLQFLEIRRGGASTESTPFLCPAHSVTTLEIACPQNTACQMSFVQDGVPPKIGFRMMQSEGSP